MWCCVKAWKAEMESRCEKLRTLQCVAEGVSSKAGQGSATALVDKLNHLSDRMNALITKTSLRQVVSYDCCVDRRTGRCRPRGTPGKSLISFLQFDVIRRACFSSHTRT